MTWTLCLSLKAPKRGQMARTHAGCSSIYAACGAVRGSDLDPGLPLEAVDCQACRAVLHAWGELDYRPTYPRPLPRGN